MDDRRVARNLVRMAKELAGSWTGKQVFINSKGKLVDIVFRWVVELEEGDEWKDVVRSLQTKASDSEGDFKRLNDAVKSFQHMARFEYFRPLRFWAKSEWFVASTRIRWSIDDDQDLEWSNEIMARLQKASSNHGFKVVKGSW